MQADLTIGDEATNALAIVDVQYDFDPASERVESAVLRQIRLAKKRLEPVFVISFLGCGATRDAVLDAVRDYPLGFHVKKGDVDGSGPLTRALERAWHKGLIQRIPKIKFCGVYTDQCVAQTILGMAGLHPKIKMICLSHACEAHDGHAQTRGLNWLDTSQGKFPNLRVAA